MRGYVRCERCDWSRIYAKLSIARIPMYCPACGRRVVREREPTETSPMVAQWRAVADGLAPPSDPRSAPPPG